MSTDLPRVVIRRPKVSERGAREVIGTTVLIDGYQVPCVMALGINAATNPRTWQVTITLHAADVTFEDEE